MKREKGKAFGAKKDPKDDACFECGKKGHFKRDCYMLKNKSKPPRQLADFKNKKKSKALLTWSDDEDESSSEDSSDELVNLALVGLDGSIDTTDSDTDTNSEDKSCSSIMELIDFKNENYELEKENVHLKKVIESTDDLARDEEECAGTGTGSKLTVKETGNQQADKSTATTSEADQLADIFTKPLPEERYIVLRRELGMCDVQSAS
ncbi:uncharacterized protein LOC135147948 [Daucus carota subsp. sativus]|uniref:uncharacterized protein LOC135147948 n=1 Tax=Daucus carota subsp. sativus TaxID=79200 RepID=UPI003082CB85